MLQWDIWDGSLLPGAPTRLRQTQWSVCYKYTHWSAKAEIKQLLQCFYQVMHTPVTGTSVSQQAKSQAARHKQSSHHSFTPASSLFQCEGAPTNPTLTQPPLQGCNCWDPHFCAAIGWGICYRDQLAKNRKAFPDLTYGCRTFLMQCKNADCGRYEARRSHILPWKSKEEVLLE